MRPHLRQGLVLPHALGVGHDVDDGAVDCRGRRWALLRRRSRGGGRAGRSAVGRRARAVTIAVCTAMSIGAAIVLEVPEHAAVGRPAGGGAGHRGGAQRRDRTGGRSRRALPRALAGRRCSSDRRDTGSSTSSNATGYDVGVQKDVARAGDAPAGVRRGHATTPRSSSCRASTSTSAREREGFVEVAGADVRTDDERARFDELARPRVDRGSPRSAASDLIDDVDANLFGASLDPDLPRDIIDDMSEMLLIGEPIAVFLAPPGSGAAPAQLSRVSARRPGAASPPPAACCSHGPRSARCSSTAAWIAGVGCSSAFARRGSSSRLGDDDPEGGVDWLPRRRRSNEAGDVVGQAGRRRPQPRPLARSSAAAAISASAAVLVRRRHTGAQRHDAPVAVVQQGLGALVLAKVDRLGSVGAPAAPRTAAASARRSNRKSTPRSRSRIITAVLYGSNTRRLSMS